jgi:hypothetical protein
MSKLPENTKVIFNIPLASRDSVANWDRTLLLLQGTLKSILNQTNENFHAFVCSHDDPGLPEFNDVRITFLKSKSHIITNPKQGSADKFRKRKQINEAAAEMGGGYIFFLDADDLVSNRCVDYMIRCGDPNGYIIPLGYCMDFETKRFYAVPGVWGKPFHQVNGSCAAIYGKPADLVANNDDEDSYLGKFVQHSKFEAKALSEGRPLHRIPFPACIYMVNTEVSLHVRSGKRSDERQAEIIKVIESHALSDCGLIQDEFGIAIKA